MMLTPAALKIRFPEFTAIDDVRVQYVINDADAMFNKARWGSLYERGMALWVAHQLAMGEMRRKQGLAGQLGGVAGGENITVGKVSVGSSSGGVKAAGNQLDNPIRATPYGAEYDDLAGLVGMGGMTV